MRHLTCFVLLLFRLYVGAVWLCVMAPFAICVAVASVYHAWLFCRDVFDFWYERT